MTFRQLGPGGNRSLRRSGAEQLITHELPVGPPADAIGEGPPHVHPESPSIVGCRVGHRREGQWLRHNKLARFGWHALGAAKGVARGETTPFAALRDVLPGSKC